MKSCVSAENLPSGGYSKPHWVRETKKSERELLESLTLEINALAKDSIQFERQYRTLLNYYRRLARDVP